MFSSSPSRVVHLLLLCSSTVTTSGFAFHTPITGSNLPTSVEGLGKVQVKVPFKLTTTTTPVTTNERYYTTKLYSKTPPGGINFEVDDDDDTSSSESASRSNSGTATVAATGSNNEQSSSSVSSSSSNSSSGKPQPLPFQNRGKVNEIDFCMSPSDVSLSRSYETSASASTSTSSVSSSPFDDTKSDSNDSTTETGSSPTQQPRILSLTRALNSASNRAVRRILLSRSWPSAEALNLSLRQVLASSNNKQGGGNGATNVQKEEVTQKQEEEQQQKQQEEMGDGIDSTNDTTNSAKCPVPRPILNIIVRQSVNENTNETETTPITEPNMSTSSSTPSPLSKMKLTDEQWVDQQMKSFRETYGLLPGYEYADSYMECILSLATSGVESERVSDVIAGSVYDDSYRRLISVLRSAGAVFEGDLNSQENGGGPRMKIAPKLNDQDICLSMLDKISIRNEMLVEKVDDKADVTTDDIDTRQKIDAVEEEAVVEVKEEVKEKEVVTVVKEKKMGIKDRFLFFMKASKKEDETTLDVDEGESEASLEEDVPEEEEIKEETETIKPEDLGAVLLSAAEPTMTRQLNVLSNIVKRALLFGGDQELLVLSETLDADKPAFIQRWYPDTNVRSAASDLKAETRPGVQFFNCLVQLLKDSYTYGLVTEIDPPFPLSPSYANSYERLTALLVELGSGYIKPVNTKKMRSIIPKTPTEEFIRFSQWEVALRQTKPDVSDYPSDLVGSWQVKDEIGGKVIGTSTVVLKSEGEVYVDPPLRGLRWRLDPGPTHLDTCTFQVLSEDGAILQYKGFMDRGARLESRFSKRSIKIRGAVTFQMRDGETALMGEDYKRDMLPIDPRTGTTRFVMSKVFDLSDN